MKMKFPKAMLDMLRIILTYRFSNRSDLLGIPLINQYDAEWFYPRIGRQIDDISLFLNDPENEGYRRMIGHLSERIQSSIAVNLIQYHKDMGYRSMAATEFFRLLDAYIAFLKEELIEIVDDDQPQEFDPDNVFIRKSHELNTVNGQYLPDHRNLNTIPPVVSESLFQSSILSDYIHYEEFDRIMTLVCVDIEMRLDIPGFTAVEVSDIIRQAILVFVGDITSMSEIKLPTLMFRRGTDVEFKIRSLLTKSWWDKVVVPHFNVHGHYDGFVKHKLSDERLPVLELAEHYRDKKLGLDGAVKAIRAFSEVLKPVIMKSA